jgi:Beta propeller domain
MADSPDWDEIARDSMLFDSQRVVSATAVERWWRGHGADREAFTEESSNDGWGVGGSGRRSVTVTQDRMYVAGVEWNWENDDGNHSSIQVVDISDPAGQMKLGASVEVDGQIESRWQMDEYEGTLRVISQEGSGWGSDLMPSVETFTIVSSDELNPLGHLAMRLPRPENLSWVPAKQSSSLVARSFC